MKRIKALLITALTAVSLPAAAQDVRYTPHNFAYGFHIEAPQQEILYSITVPEDLYRNVVSPDLTDVMIFNKNNESVPFVILPPKPESYRAMADETVPFFVLYEDKDNTTKIEDVILDFSGFTHMPHILTLEFKGEGNFNLAVHVDASSGDLTVWSSPLLKANLARLNSGGREILNDKIALRDLPFNLKYLRLRTGTTHIGDYISRITASFDAVPVYPAAQRLSVTSDTPAGEPEKRTFELGGFYPLEWVSFEVPSSYLFPYYSLYGRNDPADKWKNYLYKVQARPYHLNSQAEGSRLWGSCYRYWQLVTESSLPAGPVTASFYWRPDKLVFIAKGEGPYTVAYGNNIYTPDSSVKTAAEALEALADQAAGLETVSPQFELGGEAAKRQVIAASEDPGNHYGILLAGVLLIIVLALSAVAVKLIMDVNKKNSQA